MQTDTLYSATSLFFRGIVITISGAAMGSLVFVILCFVLPNATSFFSGEFSYALFGFGLLFLVSAIFSGFPAIIGGLLLSILIYGSIRKGKITERDAVKMGAKIGGATVFLICIVIIALTFYIGPGHGMKYTIDNFDWLRYVFYTVIAISIASLSGGRTGKLVFKDMVKNGVGK